MYFQEKVVSTVERVATFQGSVQTGVEAEVEVVRFMILH